MSRHYLSTTSLALVLGVSLAAPGSAQEGQVPFCSVDEAERNFPCKGANSEVVQNNDALMTAGGGVPEQRQINEAMAAGAADVQPEAEMLADQEAAEEIDQEGDLQAQLEADEQARQEAEEQVQQETEAEAEAQAEQSLDDPAAIDAQAEPDAQAPQEATDEADLKAQLEAEAQAQQSVDDEAAAEAQDEPDAQAPQEATDEADLKAQLEAEAQAQQSVDDEAAAEAQGEPDAQAPQEATDEADLKAQLEAEEQARQDAEDQTQSDTAAESEPDTEEAVAPAQSEADAAAEEGVGDAAPAEAEAEPEAEAQEGTEDEADLKARLEAEEEAQQEAGTQADQDETDQSQEADAQADSQIDQQTEEEAQAEAEEEAERAARRAERRSEQSAAAAAEDASDAEIVKETVAEDDVRSADEEFETNVAATGQTIDAPKAKKDDGMSKFEKALLLGLGAAVVGTVLSNGDEVVSNSGDRVVVRRDGELAVLKNDDALLRRPGSDIGTQSFSDGSTRTTVSNADGSRIVTIRDADGSVLRRSRILASGEEYLLFDDTRQVEPVSIADLPRIDTSRTAFVATPGDDAALSRALDAELRGKIGRSFSLEQVRTIRQVRELAPQVEVDAITFATGSAAISPDKARELANLGRAISDLIRRQPGTVILVEGHTDAVGDDSYNLALSDRRAETVALALTQYFDVPPENMVTQGFGERYLKVQTQKAEPTNRRAVVRNVTRLLQ